MIKSRRNNRVIRVERLPKFHWTSDVEGAVDLVKDAVDRLRASELDLSESKRDDLVSNLLVVLCGGEEAKPMIQVQSGTKSDV